MAKYICAKCGYVIETEKMSDDYKCPMCGTDKEDIKLVTNDVFQEDLDSIIESVVEEAPKTKKPALWLILIII